MYVCPRCGHLTERSVPLSERNRQTCDACGVFDVGGALYGFKLERDLIAEQKVIQIPKAFHTSKELVMGAPGSKERDAFEADLRSGKTVYAGPGSRWV